MAFRVYAEGHLVVCNRVQFILLLLVSTGEQKVLFAEDVSVLSWGLQILVVRDLVLRVFYVEIEFRGSGSICALLTQYIRSLLALD